MRFPKPSSNLTGHLLALLLVLAVATVLITPDPTDDVSGVVRAHRAVHVPVLALVFAPFSILLFINHTANSESVEFTTLNLLQLLRTCRC